MRPAPVTALQTPRPARWKRRHGQEEPEGTAQPSKVWGLRWDSEMEEGLEVKTEEMRINNGCYISALVYYDKRVVLM